eukprot:scaffold290374_cov21-Prasinocladus_malaysianus.AAC.1
MDEHIVATDADQSAIPWLNINEIIRPPEEPTAWHGKRRPGAHPDLDRRPRDGMDTQVHPVAWVCRVPPDVGRLRGNHLLTQ